MSRLLKYRCESEVFFKDYLPDEFFINLSEEQRISFRKLRESHLLVEIKNKELAILKKEIKERQKVFKKLTANIGTKNHPNSHKGKLHIASQSLQELSKLFKFSISVGLRYHDTSNKKNPKFYLRVKSHDNNFKNIYVGRPNDIKNSLYKIRNFSFEEYNNDDLKLELRLLYTVYIRYFVWENNWKTFFSQKHQLKDVEYWSLLMNNEFLRW
jgi:hypothetical protein|tara:strand:+ start:7821 stop:8456 length:636 start_codon:yes stop_codon:yes gene_type:complete